MQKHRERKHRRAAQSVFGPLRLFAFLVQVRNYAVEQQKKQDSNPESNHRRHKRPRTHSVRLLERRDQQTPDRSRRHYAGGKAGHCAAQ